MKKYYLVFLVLLSISVFAQNKNNPLLKFDTSNMETSVLVHKSPIVDIQNYNEKELNMYDFYQAYKTIAHGDLDKQLLPLQNLKEQSKQSYFTNIIPLAILLSDYEMITDEALQSNLVSRDSEGYLVNDGSAIFETQQLIMASALRVKHKGLQTTYNLASSNIYNKSDYSIESVEIDFNDGEDYRIIDLNENVTVNYSEAGKKLLNFKITLDSGEVKVDVSNLASQTYIVQFVNIEGNLITKRIVIE